MDGTGQLHRLVADTHNGNTGLGFQMLSSIRMLLVMLCHVISFSNVNIGGGEASRVEGG